MSYCELLLLVCDRLAGSLAGAGIVLGVLSADRKSSSVANASVAADLGEHLDVHRNITAKITFDHVVCCDLISELLDLVVCQISAAGVRIDSCSRENLVGRGAADAIDGSEADLYSLVSG